MKIDDIKIMYGENASQNASIEKNEKTINKMLTKDKNESI